MAKVYAINNEGKTEEMKAVYCKNEDLELQQILESNPELIPGEQINPSDPRRWLLVKREMPVPDPATGDNRWSIDFFFVDQDAMPTFIECKRYNDTRAKREVIGQMLEYAANGHHYWSKEEMRTYAEQAADKNGVSLEEEISRLQHENSETIDDFFQRVQDNLRMGQVRLVFFMEEAPAELKSVVDFLNKQMERSEVLIVEARQYEHKGLRIVTPTLFGFTEEARLVKRTVSVAKRVTKQWDEESFFGDVTTRLTEKEVSAIKKIFNRMKELNFDISWGVGKTCGSFSAKWAGLESSSVFTIYSTGTFTVNYGNLKKLNQEGVIEFLQQELSTHMELSPKTDYSSYRTADNWTENVDGLLTVLEHITEKYPA